MHAQLEPGAVELNPAANEIHTALYAAAESGRVETIRALVEAGHSDSGGLTPPEQPVASPEARRMQVTYHPFVVVTIRGPYDIGSGPWWAHTGGGNALAFKQPT
jgi:hypothetical protein